jgi:hypothetical protein
MNTIARTFLIPGLLLCAAGAVALFAMNRGDAQAQSAASADKSIAEYQRKLLDLAFTSASAMPTLPHIKNRCRVQETVVATCFDLDQPQRALECVEKIDNWRKGAGYADYAFYCARHGVTKDVQRYLELAQKISDQGEETISQDWQKDRIKVAIAKTHAWLGEIELASRFETGIEHAEMGKVDAVRAQRGDAADFEGQTKALDAVFANGDFDLVHNALDTCAQLFNRFYDDAPKRDLMEQRIKSSWGKLPLQVRLEALMELAGFALLHHDDAKALALVDDAQAILDGAKWLPENYTPLAAPIAALRWKAGDREKARAQLDAVLALYEQQRGLIVDIYRAGSLRPIAEAYEAMGDGAKALAIYKRAVEEGVANPNSRPRAEDLAATCCSMAKATVEPDAALWVRLQEVSKGLRAPW